MSDPARNRAEVSDSDPTMVRVDVQDPLPETNWFWRRVYTFMLSLVSVAFIWYGMEALTLMREAESVYQITRYMIGVHVILITFYMVAPSAEQIVKMIQATKLMRDGVTVSRTVVAETPGGGRTEVSTSAGQTPASEPDDDDVAPRSRP